MYTVYFDVSWDQSGAEFLDDIRKMTPDNSGRWGQVRGVADPDAAEYHVALNHPTREKPGSQRLLFCMEPPCTTACTGWDSVEFVASYPLSDFYKPQTWHLLKTYDGLSETEPIRKTADLSWVTSDKGRDVTVAECWARQLFRRLGISERKRQSLPLLHRGGTDGHVLRMAFLDDFLNAEPELLDLYGRGDFAGPHYRGEIEDKWDGLADYRYSLAVENYKGPHYFSEKLTDALLAWCMPIYWGCTNLEEYLPADSFVRIDIKDDEAPERVREIVESDLRERNLDAIAEARRRLLDEYQIWPTVEQKISDLDG